MNKILIIQTASIGDVILATPVIEKLHLFYPNARIDFLLKKGNEALFDGHPFLNEVLIWEKSKAKYKNLFLLITKIRAKKYDCVINLQRFLSSGFVTVLSGANLKIGFDKNPVSFGFDKKIKHVINDGKVHEIDRNSELVKEITDGNRILLKLYPGAHHFSKVSEFKFEKYITISPASLWFTKEYPEAKWIEFIQEIDPYMAIYFLGSSKDSSKIERIIEQSGHQKSTNLSGRLSFLESAALMKDAKMNFVNDSAPLHLASSVNAPVTAIFCSTIPEFGFGPLSDNSVIVQTGEKLSCRPCGLHGFKECPEKHFKCALTINTLELLNRLN